MTSGAPPAEELSITWHDRAAELPEALWRDCFPSPLEGRWWYETLEASGLEDQFRFMYALMADASGPLAIAPAFLMDVPIRLVVPPALLPVFDMLGRVLPALRQQRTLFVGSPCSDEGTVGMLPRADRLAVLRRVERAVRERALELRAPMRVWKDFPVAFDPELPMVAREAGLFRLASFPGTSAELRGPDLAGYLASLSGPHRHGLKKKLRRSRATATLVTEVLRQPDAAALDEIFGLFMQTYRKATTQFERLDRPFFEHIAAARPSHFVVLREADGGAMVAFMLCFAFDEAPAHVINKFIGIDYARPAEWFTYFRLWEAAVDWALARGATSIQSGQTGYAAKLRIGHRPVALTNHCVHRNPLVNWVYKTVARGVSWRTLDVELAEYVKAHPEAEPPADAPPRPAPSPSGRGLG